MKRIINFFIYIGKPLLTIIKGLSKIKLPKDIFIKRKKRKNILLKKNKPVRISKNKITFNWKYPALFLLTLLITALLLWIYQRIFSDLPNINEIYNPPKLSTKIYDRQGLLLYQFHEDEDRSWVN
ncbi:MAG TPA: hypothetical protein PKI92_02280, partial [Candidatus Woesebacteria bacterium]|nr:hypothetical protein [Candidatus Woesebacteria bacterium]